MICPYCQKTLSLSSAQKAEVIAEQKALTPTEYNMLLWIGQYIDGFGISPTLDEIAEHFGTSKVTVFERKNALVRKGAISSDRHLARSIRLVEV